MMPLPCQYLLKVRLHRFYLTLSLVVFAVSAAADPAWDFIDTQIAAHPSTTGVYVLDRGEDALLARAVFTDHALTTIEVQYFIWSTDNIGILASAALLRAAERGVRVRIIVDDLLIDAPDKALLALALHPNIEIRIYNPRHSVGTSLPQRVYNVARDFRGANQRMHNKTFIVDGKLAITGGRNMADEYFDFDHAYNFRDRDVLLVGAVVPHVSDSFEQFWNSPLSVSVEELYQGRSVMQKHVTVDAQEIQAVYRSVYSHAADHENFAPEIRATIEAMPSAFPTLAQRLRWTDVTFISDAPGKNTAHAGLKGGGLSTAALAALLATAQQEVLIQSPYLVLSTPAMALFQVLRTKGVRIRISTNSLLSTDNLQAFSGYRNQRARLLKLGIEIYEYRPDPVIQKEVMQRYEQLQRDAPVFALHAKTLVVDNAVAFVGTYNLDPRSENLNTEVGAIIEDAVIARQIGQAILTDMLPENSWNAATDNPDQYASYLKRARTRFWQMMPIKPLL